MLQTASSQRNWLIIYNRRNISVKSLKGDTVEHNSSKDQSTWFLFVVGSESVALGMVQSNVSKGSDSQSSMWWHQGLAKDVRIHSETSNLFHPLPQLLSNKFEDWNAFFSVILVSDMKEKGFRRTLICQSLISPYDFNKMKQQKWKTWEFAHRMV